MKHIRSLTAHGEPIPFPAAADDVAVVPAGTPWRVPWELLMLGPFASCVLADGNDARHVTAGALMRSASLRKTGPDEKLHADDYRPLLVFAPDTTLWKAAKLAVETGWELAVVNDVEPRLITPRSVFRLLLNVPGTSTLSLLSPGFTEPLRQTSAASRTSPNGRRRSSRHPRNRARPAEPDEGCE